MAVLHQDRDILKYEPALFGNALFVSQTVGKGATGVLNATAFSATGGNFTSLGISAGWVIFLQSLDGVINGAYEITAVVSATALTISVLRADSAGAAIPVGTGSGLIWRIMTFAPQAAEALFSITQRLGIAPGNPDSPYGIEDIDSAVLRQASVFSALAVLYGSLYGSGTGTASELKAAWDMYLAKQKMYATMAEAAIGQCRISLT
jgi:hypothetical protein